MTGRRGDGSTTTCTKAGQKSSQPERLRNHDFDVWHEYFRTAIVGIVSAHRRTLSPELVARIGAIIASRALEEYQSRNL